MRHAAYRTDQRPRRSRIDRLADRAPAPLRTQAGAVALAIDKMVTASQRAKYRAANKVRAKPFPFVLAAVAVGAGAALLAYPPTRRAIGGAVSNAGRMSFGALGRQLSKEIRSLVR
jgi:hypothetical protein